MNFAITGKRITTTKPDKKPVNLTNIKSKPQPKPQQNNFLAKKPSLPSKPNISSLNANKKKDELKKQVLKVQRKQEVKIKEENKPQNIQNTQKQVVKNILIQKPPQLPKLLKQEGKRFDLLVRYNHYKDKFSTQDNILKYEVIENKYNFADLFKGNYQPRLQIYKNYGKYIEPLTSGRALDFTWQIDERQQYEITIAQDEQQESKYERKVFIAQKEEKCPLKKNNRVLELTKQMREMNVEELGGAKHKQLLEQRALQEILFS